MTLRVDESTEFGARVRRRLEEEMVIWLTTVDGKGKPFPSLVWFLFDGEDTVLIWSQPGKPKLINIASNPAVGVNFNSDAKGGDLVVFQGNAALDRPEFAEQQKTGFLEKYGRSMKGIGFTPPEVFFDHYSVPILVTMDKVRGF